MGIKLLFFTGFSKFVAHESVAFMLVSKHSLQLYLAVSDLSREPLSEVLFGVGWELFQLLSALWLLCIRF